MLRVADLGEQQWRCHLSQRVPEAENKSTSRVDDVAITKGSQTSAADHEYTPDDYGRLATIVIRDIRRDEEGDDGPDVEHVDEQAQLVVVGDVLGEEVLPELDLLGRVDEAAIVAGRARGYHEHEGHGVQLAQMRLPPPRHLCELRTGRLRDVQVDLDGPPLDLRHLVLTRMLMLVLTVSDPQFRLWCTSLTRTWRETAVEGGC